MANKFQIEIQETLEELEHRLERAITAVSKENYCYYTGLPQKNQNKRTISPDAEAR
jgi:hypothetical protein